MAVALHPEGVDRNYLCVLRAEINQKVALHPEGVDRNRCLPKVARVVLVALHPEGVDRNLLCPISNFGLSLSPSTRRAWIEIVYAMLSSTSTDTSPSPREDIDKNIERIDDNVKGLSGG